MSQQQQSMFHPLMQHPGMSGAFRVPQGHPTGHPPVMQANKFSQMLPNNLPQILSQQQPPQQPQLLNNNKPPGKN